MRQYIMDIETVAALTEQMRDYKINIIKPHGGLKDPAKIEKDIEEKLAAIEGREECDS